MWGNFILLLIAIGLSNVLPSRAREDMVHIGSFHGLAYYAMIPEQPLSWEGQRDFCRSKNMRIPTIISQAQNREFHDWLNEAMRNGRWPDIERRFWLHRTTDGEHCQYTYYTLNWMGTAWADCDAEIMHIAICKGKA